MPNRSAQYIGPTRPALRLSLPRSIALAILVVTIALATSACEMADPVLGAIGANLHELEVVNHCLGDDATVSVYLNGSYVGDVFYRRSFTILTGPLTLTAIGTGRTGGTFTNSTFATGDLVWTLCPTLRRGLDPSAAPDGDGVLVPAMATAEP